MSATTILVMNSVVLCATIFLTIFPHWLSAVCPKQCSCTQVTSSFDNMSEIHIDCVNRDIHSISDIYPLDANVTQLDLRKNKLTIVPTEAFNDAPNLSVIQLDHNEISEIQPHAFKGLHRLLSLSLKHNKVKVVRENAFSDMSGDPERCSVHPHKGKLCAIYLSYNNIRTVQKQAFDWIKGLEIILGHSSESMTIEPYAFYGARMIPRIAIHDVALLTLRARLFTNTQDVDRIELHDVKIDVLSSFVFEGLSSVKNIRFRNAELNRVESYAFSGITFTPGGHYHTDMTVSHPRGGGIVNFTSCRFQSLPIDVFRDTNLAGVYIAHSYIMTIEGRVFRGMTELRVLEFIGNQIDVIGSESFGSIRHADQVLLDDNRLQVVDAYAFDSMNDIGMLRIGIGSDMTLRPKSFSNVRNINTLEFYSKQRAHQLEIEPQAFDDLVGVESLVFLGIHIPKLGKDLFRGIRKVKQLQIMNSSVTDIDNEVFGPVLTNTGGVEQVYMTAGSELVCDCRLALTLTDLATKFSRFEISCLKEQNESKTVRYTVTKQNVTSLLCSSGNTVYSLIRTLYCILFCVVGTLIVS